MFDVVIIGGGPGGYAAGIRSAQLGGKVALVEAADIGGTCVNRGCIPAKVWGQSAQIKRVITGSGAFGIEADITNLDLSAIRARKEGASNDIKMGMGGLLANNRIEVIEGRGVIKKTGMIEVAGKQLQTKAIIIATGTSPAVPDIEGLEMAHLSTDQLFDLEQVPGSVLVYGAGHVEVEMAEILNAFDCEVTLAFEEDRILAEEDSDTSQRVAAALKEAGITLLPRNSLQEVKKSRGKFMALLSGKKDTKVTVDRILTAIRKPNTLDMGLEKAGIAVNEYGYITVNDNLMSSADRIFAVGDVTGGRPFSYGATAMGVVAAENAMGQSSVFRPCLVPRGLNTSPEAAAVGLSEEEAEQAGYDVETGVFPMSVNGVAIARDELAGAVKIVSESRYGEVLGVHIVGSHANELIWGAGLAMQLEATVEDIARTVVVHPTFSESLTMASQDALGWALYLPRR